MRCYFDYHLTSFRNIKKIMNIINNIKLLYAPMRPKLLFAIFFFLSIDESGFVSGLGCCRSCDAIVGHCPFNNVCYDNIGICNRMCQRLGVSLRFQIYILISIVLNYDKYCMVSVYAFNVCFLCVLEKQHFALLQYCNIGTSML